MINHGVKFEGRTISQTSFDKSFNFAYDMTFGQNGQHRATRTGGSMHRKNGELFANTFQGKLAEYAFYEKCLKNNIICNEPDIDTFNLGIWDDFDFKINDKHLSVKSIAHFSNLLLLETGDWSSKGAYIPNQITYDYHVVIRIKPDTKNLMKLFRLFYSNTADKFELKNNLFNELYQYQIAGYIANDDLINIIKNDLVIPKGSLLNGNTPMDASNYYCQSGDFRNIDELFNLLAL